jgi:integrase
MTKRRARGDGGLHWDEARQRWIASVTVGYTSAGKRIVRKGSGKTKTAAHAALRQKVREYEDGLSIAQTGYTVTSAVNDWLAYGLSDRATATRDNYRTLSHTHILPTLGRRKLRDLKAADVDKWLAEQAKTVSTRTVRLLHSILNRSVNRAMARDLVMRNVVALCAVPRGQVGRPSKSLTFDQAMAVLGAAETSSLHAYVVLSLLTGARTEELRALTWDHVDLNGQPDASPPIMPSLQVWRSVREGGDTKTHRSRRTLALPQRCVEALTRQRQRQAVTERLVFPSANGTELDRHNVLRAFRTIVARAGLDAAAWTPRELRHSFVSLLSSNGVSIEEIAHLCGHSGTAVTESVYRHELRPVLRAGALAMDRIFRPEARSDA